MTPIYYFHIGAGKTGSSAIQAFLNTNRKLLATKHKVLYPNIKTPIDDGDFFNHELMFYPNKKLNYKALYSHFDAITEFVQKNNIEKIVLSSENTSESFAEIIKNTVERFNLNYRIIIYVRRQDTWIESAWKQWGHKSKEYKNLDDYLNKVDVNWHKIIGKWSTLLNKKNIVVKPYEQEQLPNGLIADFLSILNVDYNTGSFVEANSDYKSVNNGFSPEIIKILELCKGLNNGIHDNKMFRFLGEVLPADYRKAPFKNYGILNNEQRKFIIDKYSKPNTLLAKEYLNNEDGILFRDPVLYDFKPAELNIESIVPILMSILLNQNQRIKNIENQLKASIKPASKVICNLQKGVNAILIRKGVRERIKLTTNYKFEVTNRISILIFNNELTKGTVNVKLSFNSSTNGSLKFYHLEENQSLFNDLNSKTLHYIAGNNSHQLSIPVFNDTNKLRFDFLCKAPKMDIEMLDFELNLR